jgi:hypothetical protein
MRGDPTCAPAHHRLAQMTQTLAVRSAAPPLWIALG